MGEITDPEQHKADVKVVQDIVERVPELRKHCSHHFRNSLAGIVASAELAQRNLKDGNFEALANDLARIVYASDHMQMDLREVGL